MDSRQVFPEDFFVGQRIIEVGAGCGLTSIYLAIRGAEVTITDMDIGKRLIAGMVASAFEYAQNDPEKRKKQQK